MALKFGSREWFAFVISILILTDLAILLNIPFIRQITGFFFLTILPGLLILQILKLSKIDFLEKFILSWGLSISFLMFFGLLMNNSSPSLGYETPLATVPLLISFNIATIALIFVAYRINKNVVFSLPDFNLTTLEKAFLIVPVLFPALSIFGMNLMNTTDNNFVLMFLLFLIPIYVIFVCFFNRKFPKRLYPIVIFLISISLLLMFALRSNHIMGADVHTEYYLFRTTLNNQHWGLFGHSPLDACLSISLLPTIYQSLLNIPSEFLFKILYSLIYSICPLIIYVISKRYVGESYGFLASCFFMFQLNFLWTEYYPRTNTAILFFALAMMVLFSTKIDPLEKSILFIVFMASCTISHYSTTYVFFFIMLGAFMGTEILSKKYPLKKVASLTIMILFFSLIFFWYSQVTETAFNSGIGFIEKTFTNLNKFFIEESRSFGTQAVFGKDIMQKSILSKIEFVFTWLTFAFIGIGIITLIRRYKEMSFPELDFKKSDFLKDKFEVTYFMVALACSGLLVIMVMLPFVSAGYGMERLYGLTISILSVFFVIGGMILSKHFFFLQKKTCAKRKSIDQNASRVWAYLVILFVLVPYFLCVTGVTYQMCGNPRSVCLNSEGGSYDRMYIHDQECYSARWLQGSGELKNAIVYTDAAGGGRLKSQAGILRYNTYSLLEEGKKIKGYIYLRYYNVVDGKLLDMQGEKHNITEYQDKFTGKSKIYNNSGSEIWK